MRVSARKLGLVSVIGAAVAAGLVALAVEEPAVAAGNCGDRDKIIKMLDSKYQEGRRAIGLISGRALLEIYVSRAGTWTILATDPAGLSCVMAAGESWQEAPIALAGRPA